MHEPERRGEASGRWWRIAIVLVPCAVVVAVVSAYWSRSAPKPVDEDDEAMNEILVVRNPGYVGIEVCAECHSERAGVVRKTRHALACRPASIGAVAPGFAPGRGRSESCVPGVHFEMSRSGDDVQAVGIQSSLQGEDRQEYQIGLVYGAGGKRDEMYFAWQEDRLFHLPIAWLYPLDRWGHAVNSNQGRATPPSCLECHNTWVGHVPGTANQYRRDEMVLGVTCERCHGPGKEHVDHHRKSPNDPAFAIAHPGTFNRDRLMDVCGQCHGNTRPLGRVFSYRPGEPLDKHFRTVVTRNPEDETTNQVRYLSESKCFQKSDMTCISCHDPHRTKSAVNGCAKCHAAADCKEQPRLPAEVRPDCVGCHMPPRVWMHVHFYTTADDQYVPIAPRAEHRIGVYPEARNAVMLAWLRKQPDAASRAEAARLTSLISGHWLAIAERRGGNGRFKAAIGAYREALKIDPSPATKRLLQNVIGRQAEFDDLMKTAGGGRGPDEAIDALSKILAIKPDDSFAHGQLGTIYMGTGKREQAMFHLKEVAKCDPNDSYGASTLASMAFDEGRLPDAVALSAESHKIDPGHPGNHAQWGMALSKLERWDEAEEQFRKALAVAPAHGRANQGLSEVLRNRGQAAEAVRYARRAVHWSDPSRIDVLLTLGEAYAAADRTDDARSTFEKALAIAESTRSSFVTAIRDRLKRL